MKRKILTRIFITAASVVTVLGVVLAFHLYSVRSHKKKADSTTLSMARIDFKQPITAADAGKISAWLYQQKGVTHVLCNYSSSIAVFTYRPAVASADAIIAGMTASLQYRAGRFVPDAASLKNGCPAGF